jgi:hypothetical protein
METRAIKAIKHDRKYDDIINKRMKEERTTTRGPRTRNTANPHETEN